MSFARGALILSGSQGISLILSLLSRIILVRLLGQSLFGEFILATTTLQLSSRVLSLGLAPASQYYAGVEPEKPRVIGTSLILGVLLALAALGISWWLLGPTRGWFFETKDGIDHSLGYETYQILLPYLPLLILTMTLGVIFVPFGMTKQYGVLQAGAMLPFVLICSALALIGWKMQAAVTAQIATWVLLSIYLVWHLRPWLAKMRWDGDIARRMIHFGLKASPNVVLLIGVAKFGTLLGARYVDPAQLSLLVLGSTIVDALLSPYNAIGQLILTRSTGNEESKGKTVLEFLRLSILLFLVLTLVVGLLGPLLIPLVFGRDFGGTYPFLMVFLIIGFMHAHFKTLSNFFAGRGRPNIAAIGLVIELGIIVGGLLLFGSQLRSWAMPVVGLAGAIFGWVMAMWSMHKLTGCRLRDQILPTGKDIDLLRKALRNGKRAQTVNE